MRATAIDFAGPIYWIEWVTVNNPKFNGKVWADYNKADVKVAVMTGTSDELLLRKMAPKATRVEFKLIAEVALAVSSGRADAFTTTVLASMVMKPRTRARRLRQPDAARGPARLYRPAPGGRPALAEVPQPLGGVEHPAGP